MTQHWHVFDHYSGDSRIYPAHRRAAMRQWVRYHGGEPIVEVVACDELCLVQPVEDEDR